MDQFGIPLKITRHVLKAFEYPNEDGEEECLTFSDILHTVQYTTRNLVPVRNLKETVQKALRKLEMQGLIVKEDEGYNRAEQFAKPRMFKDMTRLDEARTRGVITKRKLSESSLSGDETTKSVKRLRTQKPLSRIGSKTHLPNIRKSSSIERISIDCIDPIETKEPPPLN